MEEKLIIPIKSLRGEEGYKTFSTRIWEELAEELDRLAQKTGRSRNEPIGIMLAYAMDHCEIA